MRHVGPAVALAGLLLLTQAVPPVSANGPVPSLLGGWHWPNASQPTYAFASSMPLQWMRNEAAAGVAASGNTRYQNPVFRLVSGPANVTVGMRPTPAPCVGSVPTVWYACSRVLGSYTSWSVDLSSSYCWMNGGRYRTCAHTLTFDVWSVVHHEFLHVNGLAHHWPDQPWNSVMLPAFPSYPNSYWQNRYPRSHDLWGLALLYAADPCTSSPCLQRTMP